jgi:hypothetical protein
MKPLESTVVFNCLYTCSHEFLLKIGRFFVYFGISCRDGFREAGIGHGPPSILIYIYIYKKKSSVKKKKEN